MKNIKRLKKRPYKTEVFLIDDNQENIADLYINGKLPVAHCPKCKRDLYAGGPESMKVFPCGCCGKILKVGWSILK